MIFDHKFILGPDGVPVPEPDLLAWGRWMQEANRTIARSNFDDVWVSTVFLGLDHRWRESDDDKPLVFETMIFRSGRYSELAMERCGGTVFDAREMHARAVKRVTSGEFLNLPAEEKEP